MKKGKITEVEKACLRGMMSTQISEEDMAKLNRLSKAVVFQIYSEMKEDIERKKQEKGAKSLEQIMKELNIGPPSEKDDKKSKK